LKADDGTTDLYWRMVKPIGFDPSKKYPTVIYVYGGPHAHNVDASWHYGSRSWETYMAQKGYLLFIIDNRGSENRGKAFEQATFRNTQTGREFVGIIRDVQPNGLLVMMVEDGLKHFAFKEIEYVHDL